MTLRLREHGIQAIVLDIEGTTTPIAFVYEVLFPFARAHLRQYLREHVDTEPVRDVVRLLRDEWSEEETSGTPSDVASGFSRTLIGPPKVGPHEEIATRPEDVAAYVEWLMDRDRKSPGLKRLQGQIWEQGYRSGVLRGEVFPDVPAALTRWRAQGITTAIYSSGSVLAQRLLFSTTAYGDLTPLINGFFDTGVGPKASPDSYRRIADALFCETARMLFVSDVTSELDAARAAGCQVLLCVRPGNRRQEAAYSGLMIRDFDEMA